MPYEFFDGICAVLLPKGLHPTRYKLLCDRFKAKGGSLMESYGPYTSHVIAVSFTVVEEEYSAWSPWKWSTIQQTVDIVSFDWLTACLVQGELVSELDFCLRREIEEESDFWPKPNTQTTLRNRQPSILVPNPDTMSKLMEQCRKAVYPKYQNGSVNRIREE